MTRIETISAVIVQLIADISNNETNDISMLFLYRHNIESIIISLINAKRIKIINDLNDNTLLLSQMVNIGLLSEEIFIFWSTHNEMLENAISFTNIIENNDPHHIHESLLGEELSTRNNEIGFLKGKVSRDSIGAYYTPPEFAKSVIVEAIGKYLSQHDIINDNDAISLLSRTRFADLSCGCGEFIKALYTYLHERYGIAPAITCRNLYGVDIDPIALQTTICDLLEITDKDSWDDIISHFTVGNPLINSNIDKGLAEKTRLYAQKRFYAFDMGIDTEKLLGDNTIDIIIGNPPWEKVRFEERKFFKSILPEISEISQKNKRQQEISKLKDRMPLFYEWYQQVSHDYVQFKQQAKTHPYLRTTLHGELNTYALFSELSLNLMSNGGVSCLIVKSAIATSPANREFYRCLLDNNNLSSICLFTNTQKIFNIDSREKFCVITCTKMPNTGFDVMVGAETADDLLSLVRNRLTVSDISIINPKTKTLPNVSKNHELAFLLNAHKRLPLFGDIYTGVHFGRLVHLTTHAAHIDTKQNMKNIPIYEGKFIERYNARYATYSGLTDSQKYSAKAYAKKIPTVERMNALPESRYYIHSDFWNKLKINYSDDFMLCWRSLTATTNTRTTLAMILPTMPTCQSIQFLQTGNINDLLMLIALFNSKPFDYLVRMKMPGIDLTQSVIRQVPVPNRETYHQRLEFSGDWNTLEEHILGRVAAILIHEPLLFKLFETLELQMGNKRNQSLSLLENEIDELMYIAYGFDEAEKINIQQSFRY